MSTTVMSESTLDNSSFAALAAERRAQRTPLQRLGDAVLGTDPKMRLAVRLGLLPSGVYVAWCVMHVIAVRLGFESQSTADWLTLSHLLGMVTFYPLVRSGYSARFDDAGMVLPQILYASASAIVGYALIPPLRAVILQMLCLIQIFGLFSLRPRQTVIAGASTAGMLTTMWLAMTLWRPLDFQPTPEAVKLALGAFIVMLLALVCRRFSHLRGLLREQTHELTTAVEKVGRIASRDPLTGLYNRQHLQELLGQEIKRQQRNGRPFAVALIDLDHFKRVNDQHGHQVGDEVLCGFAQTLQAFVRDTDVAARWGGEEFLVLLPETDTLNALGNMNRLRKQLVGLTLSPSQSALRITLSAGVATHHPHETLEQTLERADRALYAAKAGGRDRCEAAD
ncbi:GGDEF domain-containing protein [Aquabacterium sp.]|uniref:GGDEF domain-containing protein n=1 Tax=Aquabacterium sp. TaxID=1872578 RepID=UPI0035B1162D